MSGPESGTPSGSGVQSGRLPSLISKSGADIRYSSYDVLVIGGGIAGLTVAVAAARMWNVGPHYQGRARRNDHLLRPRRHRRGAWVPGIRPALHLKDTLEAGDGLVRRAGGQSPGRGGA